MSVLKKRRGKTSKQFGKDAEVIVMAEDSVYKGKTGRVINGVMSMDGTYIVAFGRGTGDQYIHADDMDLADDLATAPSDPEPEPVHVPDVPLPLSLIHADPVQPRKTFNQETLKELADDVKADGVLQAILVRPHPSVPEGHFLIVFGERRWKAATMAGLSTIPAKIREMSDERALELQLVENSHREDVHQLEEGYAFRRMRAYHTTEEIAHLIKRGKTYVRERIALTNLTPEFQKIFMDAQVSFTQALLLCRATSFVQDDILAESTKYLKPGQDGWKLGNLPELIKKGESSLDLATFETEDAKLYPDMGACGQCKHNSAVNELFGDQTGRICNNAGCYAIKTERAFQANIKHNITDGVVLVSHFGYSDLDRKRVAAAKDAGLPVLMDGAVKIVDRVPEPTLAAYSAKFVGLPDAQLEHSFQAVLRHWEQLQEEIAAAEADGRYKKAYIIAGNKAGTFQDVIVVKVASPAAKDEDQKPAKAHETVSGSALKTGIAALLGKKSDDGLSRAITLGDGLSDTYKAGRAKRDATKLFYEIVASQFVDAGEIETSAEETALVLLLWNYLDGAGHYSELQHIQNALLPGNDSVLDPGDMRLFDQVRNLVDRDRSKLIGRLARALILAEFDRDVDYTTVATGACLRELVREFNPKAVEEIETKIVSPQTAKA